MRDYPSLRMTVAPRTVLSDASTPRGLTPTSPQFIDTLTLTEVPAGAVATLNGMALASVTVVVYVTPLRPAAVSTSPTASLTFWAVAPRTMAALAPSRAAARMLSFTKHTYPTSIVPNAAPRSI